MPLSPDFEHLFANTVIEREFCDEETVAHALEIQAAARAEGMEESLSAILVEQEALTPAQAQELTHEIMARLEAVPKIPGYDSLKKIGTSGIAVLYTAHQQSVDRKVILKVMPTDDMENSPMRQRFNQEALLRARLNHKNIVGSIDFGDAPGCCYLVLVYVHDGVFLDELALQGPPLQPTVVARWIADLAEGLRQVDKQGMIHGNVCPENVLAVPNGQAWLTGFDFVAEIGAKAPIVGGARAHFVPPERPRSPARATDLYALGCTLFMLLTQKDPNLLPCDHDKVPVATAFRSRANRALAAIAYTLMQPLPGLRYRDYDTLLEDLRAAAAGRAPRHAMPLPSLGLALAVMLPDWPRSLPGRALLWLAAAGAGAAAAWGLFCGVYGNPSAVPRLPGELTARKHWQEKPDWRDRGDAAADLWLQAFSARNTPAQRRRMLAELAKKFPDTAHGRAVVFYKLLDAPAPAAGK